MLIDTPSAGMKSRVPKKEIGMPSMTHSARRISRKRPRMMMTRVRPIKAFFCSRFIRLSKISEESSKVESCSEVGSSRRLRST